jgi:hypothetical protein
MELVVRGKAQVSHFLPNGTKLPEGQKCISIVPDYVEDPAHPGQKWPVVNLMNSPGNGIGITFTADEKFLREEELLRGIEPGGEYRIIIPVSP